MLSTVFLPNSATKYKNEKDPAKQIGGNSESVTLYSLPQWEICDGVFKTAYCKRIHLLLDCTYYRGQWLHPSHPPPSSLHPSQIEGWKMGWGLGGGQLSTAGGPVLTPSC